MGLMGVSPPPSLFVVALNIVVPTTNPVANGASSRAAKRSAANGKYWLVLRASSNKAPPSAPPAANAIAVHNGYALVRASTPAAGTPNPTANRRQVATGSPGDMYPEKTTRVNRKNAPNRMLIPASTVSTIILTMDFIRDPGVGFVCPTYLFGWAAYSVLNGRNCKPFRSPL